jgi:hypothetical protein
MVAVSRVLGAAAAAAGHNVLDAALQHSPAALLKFNVSVPSCGCAAC